jgi:hypothetical protein
MKISYNWLKEYIEVDLPAEQVAEMLTFCGLEVEAIEPFESIKGGLEGLVVGEVITKEKHPRLTILAGNKFGIMARNPIRCSYRHFIFSKLDAIKLFYYSGSGLPLVSGRKGKAIKPSKKTEHIAKPA